MALQYVCDVCDRKETVVSDHLPHGWMRLEGTADGYRDFCSWDCIEGYVATRSGQFVDDIPF